MSRVSRSELAHALGQIVYRTVMQRVWSYDYRRLSTDCDFKRVNGDGTGGGSEDSGGLSNEDDEASGATTASEDIRRRKMGMVTYGFGSFFRGGAAVAASVAKPRSHNGYTQLKPDPDKPSKVNTFNTFLEPGTTF